MESNSSENLKPPTPETPAVANVVSTRPISDYFRISELAIRAAASLVWPTLVFFVVFYFGADIKAILKNSDTQTVKLPGGIELSLESKRAEATQLLGAATVLGHSEQSSGPQPAKDIKAAPPLNVSRTVDIVNQTLTPPNLSRYSGKAILWVDDHPENNEYVVQLFRSLGMTVVTSTSTDDALDKLSHRTYDVVITDMRRGDNVHAGYDLLMSMKSGHITTPLIIYSASANPTFRLQAEERGALGQTNDPTDLLRLVSSAILK